MHKISGVGATAQNTFTRGDPATGLPATVVTQEWLNTMQAELAYIVEQAGLTLDAADDTQVKAAIDAMIASGLTSSKGSMLVTLSADQNLAATSAPQDLLFDSIAYSTGLLAAATLDATGGIVVPTGVTKVKYSARMTLGGASTTVPVAFQIASVVNHVGIPDEGSSQMSYTVGNQNGVLSAMISSPVPFNVAANDVIDTRVTLAQSTAGLSVLALNTSLATDRSWMYIEAVA